MDQKKLPITIRPHSYHILISILSETLETFDGVCLIVFTKELESKSDSDTNQIILNSYELAIIEASIDSVNLISIASNIKLQQIILTFDLIPLSGILTIRYRGRIRDRTPGLFRVNNLIYTDLEPTFARYVFPCFDEPTFKAKFYLSVQTKPNLLVLGNANVNVNINSDAKSIHCSTNQECRVTFEETPLMSTYLFALFIGHSKFLKKSFDKFPLTLYADISDQWSEFILNHSARCINFLTRIFDIDLPIKKLDFLRVPQLKGAAMENSGLIMFKKTSFPEEMLVADKISVLEVIFHEICHQWTGNLVSIEWWSDIWIAEGLTTWLSYYIIDRMYSEWNIPQHYYYLETVRALSDDRLISSHPLVTDVAYPSETAEMFDGITYSKGSGIVGMIAKYVGTNIFLSALRVYVKKFANSNASTTNFLEVIEQVSGRPVTNYISSWIYQQNYPVVKIIKSQNKFIISQEPFTTLPNKSNSHWLVPLTKKIILGDKPIEIDELPEINKNNQNLFITWYDDASLKLLLTTHNLSAIDLAMHCQNLFLLLESGRITFSYYLTFLQMILQILDVDLLIKIHYDNFEHFLIRIQNKESVKLYLDVLMPFVTEIISELDFDFIGDDPVKRHSFALGCLVKEPRCVNYCRKLFTNFKQIPYQIEQIVVQTVILDLDDAQRKSAFDLLFDLTANYNQTKVFVSDLGKTPDFDNYSKVLQLILSNSINDSSKLDLLEAAGENYVMNYRLWPFYVENWNELRKIACPISRNILSPLSYLVDHKNLLNDIRSFFADKLDCKLITTKKLAKILEKIEINTHFQNTL